VRLVSEATMRAATGERSRSRVRSTTGTSDHAGCPARPSSSASMRRSSSDASARRTAPTSARSCRSIASEFLSSGIERTPASRSSWTVTSTSRRVGAAISTRNASPAASVATRVLRAARAGPAAFDRYPGQDAAQLHERLAEVHAARVEPDRADRLLVRTAALLEHGDRLADRARVLEHPHRDDGVREVAGIDPARVLQHETALREYQEGGYALSV